MARRNHSVAIRFTADEIRVIDKKRVLLGLERSDLIRKGTLLFCGMRVNPVPESVEKYYMRLNKTKLIEILGPEPGAIERIRKFFGRE